MVNAVLALFMIASIIALSVSINGEINEEEVKVEKAYQCLKDKIDDAPRVSFSEAVFGVMALGKYNGLFANITKEKKANEWCWPASGSGCKLKDTAQVLLAYDRAGESTTEIEKWLLGKNGTSVDLAWFIEIDGERQQPTSCSLKWDGGTGSIKIDANAKISGSPGSCLMISSSGYLLRIRDSCINKRFDITCNGSFITTLLYQKNKGDQTDCLSQSGKTCYVIGETHSAASLGTTSEEVKASCFKAGNSCDYEGSLWSALALAQTGRDVSPFIPYLLSLAEDNQRYFPDSFLYALIRDEGAYSQIISSRKSESYWEIAGSPYNRFYDTSLGLIGLSGFGNTDEIDKTKEYLLGIQTRDGCWNNNNIRDTAFILYSGWKKGAIGSGSGTGGGLADCLSVANANYDCATQQECTIAGGQVLDNFFCSGIKKCCSVRMQLKTCNELGGKVCGVGKECSQGSLPASDGACCQGTCEDVIPENTCSSQGGECKASCSSGESDVSYTCSGSSLCCVADEEKGSSWIWILLLMILIVIIIIAILYRQKIQVWWFNQKRKKQGGGMGGATGSRPGGGLPPRPGSGMPMQIGRPFAARPPMPRPASAPAPKVTINVKPGAQVNLTAPKNAIKPKAATRTSPKKNKELEDTLKKLRDMSK